ncbi:hypothetical protein Poli38472_010168 [Pythium oligandrum]|uniref:Uncharacterized protein n=1 Tax=Pythium oligandrum TaxID=41045 RepID=A0A8K1C8V6_PYTOL|nr:hypothetical protein Poli38472_010168 [Pythium oligandrum]|eukprot:TMW58609.1 hypothetical protein Poli38472_010168 [Pythium oligandrum]
MGSEDAIVVLRLQLALWSVMVYLSCAVGSFVKTYEFSSDGVQVHRQMGALNAEVTCARYNHNGKILASCSVDGGICLDVAASGELLSRFFSPAKTPTERRLNAVNFSSGSRFLASGGNDGCVRVWDLKTQDVTQTYSVSASAVTSVAFSGYKDDFIVAGSASGAISVCDVQSTENIGFLSVDSKFDVASVTSVLASPHPYARQIVGSTYSDGSVRVWDLHTGQLTAEFASHHEAAATSLAISPVSKVLLATGGYDRRVLFFDTLQRKELRSMDFEHPVSALALCADGKTLAVGTVAGTILVYDLRGVISPLATVHAHDGGPTAINSLHFAAPTADATSAFSNTAVFPQGQPVLSTERRGSSINGMMNPPSPTNQEVMARKLQALGLSEASSPTKPESYYQQQPSTPGLTINTQIPYEPPSTQMKLEERRMSEPSLLSMLAESPRHQNRAQSTIHDSNPVALPLVSPTNEHAASPDAVFPPPTPSTTTADRNELQHQLQQLRMEMEQQWQQQQKRFDAFSQMLLTKYDTLVDENRGLRRENDTLRDYLNSRR